MTVEKKSDDNANDLEIVVEESAETNANADGATGADQGAGKASDGNAEGTGQQASAASDDEELEQYSESVKKRIGKLTGRLREAERREQAAIEYAKSVQAEYERTASRAQSLEGQHLREYKERLQAQEIVLKNGLAQAIEAGDVNKQVAAQQALSALAVEQERYRHMEGQQARRAQPQQQEQRPQQVQQPQAQPPAPDPKAQQWAERNKWFGSDEAMTITAFSIHKRLVEEEGVDPTSDSYYKELDKRIRGEFPHKFQSAAPSPTTVAPGSRQTAPGQAQPNTKNVVKLTNSQVAIAKKLGISIEQYARQLQKLRAEREGY